MMRERWSRFWRANEGLGAIEFGFVAPVLVAILLGILDFGLAFWNQMEVANAADSGTQWAMVNSFDANSITQVAQAATSLSIPSSQITPTAPYGCASSTGVQVYSQGSTCPDGSAAQPYIIVTAYVCYKPIFPSWPGLNYCSGTNSQCNGCNTDEISLSSQSVVLK